jgi:hypothetical protein
MFYYKSSTFKFSFTWLLLLCFGLIFSCKKVNSTHHQDVNIGFNVELYSNSLMSDSNFFNFLENTSIALIKFKLVVSTSEISAQIHHTEFLNSIANFASTNPSFFMLNIKNRESVFEYLQMYISNFMIRDFEMGLNLPLYTINNKLRILFKNETRIKVYSSNSEIFEKRSLKLTTNYIIGCALAAIGGALLSYGDAINDIQFIITQGWTGIALANAAIDILKNASPWWKVAGIALGFGGCLLTAID